MIKIEKIDEMVEKITNKEITVKSGERRVLGSYMRTKSEYPNSPYIVVNDIIWENELEDFLNFFHKMNIEKIIIADTSTALMNTLTYLIDNGAMIETTIKIKRDSLYSDYESGLIMKIK